MSKAKRIGPMMAMAREYVSGNPGCTMLEVAEAVGPHGSRMYGYRTVHRAAAAGLIRLVEREHKAGCYRCYPQEGE